MKPQKKCSSFHHWNCKKKYIRQKIDFYVFLHFLLNCCFAVVCCRCKWGERKTHLNPLFFTTFRVRDRIVSPSNSLEMMRCEKTSRRNHFHSRLKCEKFFNVFWGVSENFPWKSIGIFRSSLSKYLIKFIEKFSSVFLLGG